MSRNNKPDNIIEAFLYIAKRCLTPAEQNDLAEKLRDPRIQPVAPAVVPPAGRSGYAARPVFNQGAAPQGNQYQDPHAQPARQPRGRGIAQRHEGIPAPASYNTGFVPRGRGNNNNNNNNNATLNNTAPRGRGAQAAAPLAPMAVSAGGPEPVKRRNNRRPQGAAPAEVVQAVEAPRQNRRRGRGGAQGAAAPQQ